MIKGSELHKNRILSSFLRLILSLSISLIFMLVVYYTCGIWFETNDDVFVSELLSGKLTGTPEPYCTFISLIVTYPVSLMYKLFPVVAWWGIFIFIVLLASLTILFYVVLDKAGSWLCKLIALVITGSFSIGCVHIFGQAEFTSAAILLAFAGYVVICAYGVNKVSLVTFILCQFIAASVRDTSMMIVQPIGMCAFLGFEIMRERAFAKETIRKIIIKCAACVAIVLSIIGIVSLVKAIAFNTPDAARQKLEAEVFIYLHDYSTNIDYCDVQDILAESNIFEKDFIAWQDYHDKLDGTRLSDETLEALSARLAAIREQEPKHNAFISLVQLLLTSDQFWHIHQITFAIFALAFVLAFIMREYKGMLSLAGIMFGYIFGLFILACRDRFVLRVMLPYYLGAVMLVLLFTMTQLAFNRQHNVFVKLSLVIALIVYAGAILYAGKVQFSYVRRQNQIVNQGYFTTLNEINAYCNSQPDKHFLLDFDYAKLAASDIFETDYFSKSNCYYTGGWCTKNQSVSEYGNDYLSVAEIYYLVYEAQAWLGRDGLDYYADIFNSQAVLTDKFMLSTGATIWVYRLDK